MGQDPAPIGCLPRAIGVGAESDGFYADRLKSQIHIPPSERLAVLFAEILISARDTFLFSADCRLRSSEGRVASPVCSYTLPSEPDA